MTDICITYLFNELQRFHSGYQSSFSLLMNITFYKHLSLRTLLIRGLAQARADKFAVSYNIIWLNCDSHSKRAVRSKLSKAMYYCVLTV